MGFFKTFLIGSGMYISYGIYSFIKIGNKLPQSTKITGNYLGLVYQYFKYTLIAWKPNKNEHFNIIEDYKKLNFQNLNFNRELRFHSKNLINQAKETMPSDLVYNPFEKYNLQMENEKNILANENTSLLLKEIELEKIDIDKKNLKKKNYENFYKFQ